MPPLLVTLSVDAFRGHVASAHPPPLPPALPARSRRNKMRDEISDFEITNASQRLRLGFDHSESSGHVDFSVFLSAQILHERFACNLCPDELEFDMFLEDPSRRDLRNFKCMRYEVYSKPCFRKFVQTKKVGKYSIVWIFVRVKRKTLPAEAVEYYAIALVRRP